MSSKIHILFLFSPSNYMKKLHKQTYNNKVCICVFVVSLYQSSCNLMNEASKSITL